MNLSDFDFALPPELIALRPAPQRDGARLLVVHADGRLEHAHFRDLPGFLRPPDLLVVNDSRVIPARLAGRRLPRREGEPGVEVEITLLEERGEGRFSAFAKPGRRLRAGDRLRLGDALDAVVEGREGAELRIRFAAPPVDLAAALERVGQMPLPPYIASRRPPDAQDRRDYQTVYARNPGSVAAPTAGLHFTQGLLNRLAGEGIGLARVTLHVGAGTFLPVTADDVRRHVMHPERAMLAPEAAEQMNRARDAGGRLVAVGTTALRTMESAADGDGRMRPFDGATDIFITPGYRFRAADMLVTNFHLPCSTLFMLVAAFSGLDVMKRAYAEAIARRYRFYSYGDACLLFRPR
jgi:S-adenosylmethionine:tRNA ribosyltransferase-isomerase